MMDFAFALRLMLSEKRCFRRSSWRPDKAVYQVKPEGKLPYLEIRTSDGDAPYTPSQCDMVANDWVEELEKAK